MNERIKDKIEEIQNYLEELSKIIPDNLESYKRDFKTKAACERYAEKIIEAVTDLTFLVIKEKNLSSPENDLQAFEILFKNKIIPFKLSEKLQDAKSMRNILAHEYGVVNDEIVYDSITQELEKDVNDFIDKVKRSSKKLKT